MNNVPDIIKRLKHCLKIKTDVELAEQIGVTQSAISQWKSRNSIDIYSILPYLPTGTDLNWILKGDEDTPAHKPEDYQEKIFKELQKLSKKVDKLEFEIKKYTEDYEASLPKLSNKKVFIGKG